MDGCKTDKWSVGATGLLNALTEVGAPEKLAISLVVVVLSVMALLQQLGTSIVPSSIDLHRFLWQSPPLDEREREQAKIKAENLCFWMRPGRSHAPNHLADPGL